MFERKYIDYGVVKVWNGCVEVYCSNQEYHNLVYPSIVIAAYWSGASIITTDRDGTQYRWSDFGQRERIY